MLYALGLFVFEASTALPDDFSRDRNWRQERTARFGARAAAQFTGPGDDNVTIGGRIVPEVCGSYSSLDTLAEMADAGDAYCLCRGDGAVLGQFTIEALREKHADLIDNGLPRSIEFSIELARVPDDADGTNSSADTDAADNGDTSVDDTL